MAERILNIRLGLLGEGAITKGLRGIKKDMEGLDTITKAFSGRGAFGALVDGMRIAATWAEKIREQMDKVAIGAQTWQASIGQIGRELPVIGDTMRLIEAITGKVSPDEQLRRSLEARGLGRQNRDEFSENLFRRKQATRFGGELERFKAGERFSKEDVALQDRITELQEKLAKTIDQTTRDVIQTLIRTLEAQRKIAREEVERAIANSDRKPLIKNFINRGRAGLQDLLTQAGIAGADVLEGAAPLLRRRRRATAEGVPLSRISETLEGVSGAAFAAREATAIAEANKVSAEKMDDAAEKMEQAADLVKQAGAGFLGAVRAFAEVVGAPRPIGG